MNMRKEYKRRAQLAKEIAEGECYRSYPMWGVNYTETIREIQKRNRKLARTNGNYLAVPSCDNRCIVRVCVLDDGTDYVLESYDTDVCTVHCTFDGWYFTREWDGWTATTMKHVNAFREQFGFSHMNKYEWLMLDDLEFRDEMLETHNDSQERGC